MEEELLKELDSILNPAVSNAWHTVKRRSNFGGDPRTPFLDALKVEIDLTKVDLSKTMYKMDLAMQGMGTDVERAEADMLPLFSPVLTDIDQSDYVRELGDGFEVWDGVRWNKLTKEANIKLELFENPEAENRPAVKVWARDESLQKTVVFIDNDLHMPGYDIGYSHLGEDIEGMMPPVPNEHYWEDPFYGMTKTTMAVGSRAAGALAMRHVGNLTPSWTGRSFRNAEGCYRNAEGVYENLNKQRGIGAGGYQKSAKRALGKAKVFRNVGGILFIVGVSFSGAQIGDAIINDYSNKSEVITKATVDIFIGAVGFWGGPVGWAIAGTYFLLDSTGAFGSWGKPSGISRWQHEQNLLQEIRANHGYDLQSLQFEIDYLPPIEQQQRDMFKEEREVKRDNTSVSTPKILYLKD